MNRLSDAGSIPAWSIGKPLIFQGFFLLRSSPRSSPYDRIKVSVDFIGEFFLF